MQFPGEAALTPSATCQLLTHSPQPRAPVGVGVRLLTSTKPGRFPNRSPTERASVSSTRPRMKENPPGATGERVVVTFLVRHRRLSDFPDCSPLCCVTDHEHTHTLTTETELSQNTTPLSSRQRRPQMQYLSFRSLLFCSVLLPLRKSFEKNGLDSFS